MQSAILMCVPAMGLATVKRVDVMLSVIRSILVARGSQQPAGVMLFVMQRVVPAMLRVIYLPVLVMPQTMLFHRKRGAFINVTRTKRRF